MTFVCTSCYWNWECERDGAAWQCAVLCLLPLPSTAQPPRLLSQSGVPGFWTSGIIPGLAAVSGVHVELLILVKRGGMWICTCCLYQDLASSVSSPQSVFPLRDRTLGLANRLGGEEVVQTNSSCYLKKEGFAQTKDATSQSHTELPYPVPKCWDSRC